VSAVDSNHQVPQSSTPPFRARARRPRLNLRLLHSRRDHTEISSRSSTLPTRGVARYVLRNAYTQTRRLPSVPQHLQIRSITFSLSPRPSPGSSTSRKSSKNPSLLLPLRPVAHVRIELTPTISSPRSLFDICSSFFGDVRRRRSMSLSISFARAIIRRAGVLT